MAHSQAQLQLELEALEHMGVLQATVMPWITSVKSRTSRNLLLGASGDDLDDATIQFQYKGVSCFFKTSFKNRKFKNTKYYILRYKTCTLLHFVARAVHYILFTEPPLYFTS